MKKENYILKITDKVDNWLECISPDDAVYEKVLEFLIEELESNPYPREDKPKLIRVIRGLKSNNPKIYRIRLEKNLGLQKNYRLFYSIIEVITEPKYIIALDYSTVDEKSKKQTIERLKKITCTKFENMVEEVLID
jgi:hypothetical protein